MSIQYYINEDIETDTSVIVTPDIEIGNVETRCVGKGKITKCCNYCNQPTYMIDQLLRVRFPISFSVTASANIQHVSYCNPENDCTQESPSHPPKTCRKCNQNNRVRRTFFCIIFLFLGLPFKC